MYICWLWGSWLSSCYTAIKPSRKLRHPVHYHEWDLSSSGDYNGGKGNEDYGYDDVPLYFFMAKPRDNMQYKVPTSILTLQPLLLGIVGKSLATLECGSKSLQIHNKAQNSIIKFFIINRGITENRCILVSYNRKKRQREMKIVRPDLIWIETHLNDTILACCICVTPASQQLGSPSWLFNQTWTAWKWCSALHRRW